MAVLVLAVLSCSKDDPDNPNNTVPDPEGTITANITGHDNNSITPQVSGKTIGQIKWCSPDNFYISGYGSKASICNVGVMKGLGNITRIPTSGYTAPSYNNYETACEQGHGYVVKFEQFEWQNGEYVSVGEYVYVRLYVVEPIVSTAGGIMGAKVKYQFPFEP